MNTEHLQPIQFHYTVKQVREGLHKPDSYPCCACEHLSLVQHIQGLDNETETAVILVWEVSWLNWTNLVANLP